VSVDKEYTDALLQRIESWTYVAEDIVPFMKGNICAYSVNFSLHKVRNAKD